MHFSFWGLLILFYIPVTAQKPVRFTKVQIASESYESAGVFDVNKDGNVVQVEYFVLAGTQETFNSVRQAINLSIIGLLEKMHIKLATKETKIVLQKEG